MPLTVWSSFRTHDLCLGGENHGCTAATQHAERIQYIYRTGTEDPNPSVDISLSVHTLSRNEQVLNLLAAASPIKTR